MAAQSAIVWELLPHMGGPEGISVTVTQLGLLAINAFHSAAELVGIKISLGQVFLIFFLTENASISCSVLGASLTEFPANTAGDAQTSHATKKINTHNFSLVLAIISPPSVERPQPQAAGSLFAVLSPPR
jgi:hypothetical protein